MKSLIERVAAVHIDLNSAEYAVAPIDADMAQDPAIFERFVSRLLDEMRPLAAPAPRDLMISGNERFAICVEK